MTPNNRPRHSRGLLRTYAWLIVTATAVTLAVAAGVAASAQTTYTSSAQVVVKPLPTAGTPIQPQMGTERAIALSGEVAERAAERLGTEPDTARDGLSVTVLLETTVLQISYTAASPEEAVEGARAFTNAYVDHRNATGAARTAEMVTTPELPTRGSGANLLLVLGLGALAGVALGVGSAWLWDRTTDRLRDGAELEELTGVPVLGTLPRWERRAGWLAPSGPAGEAVGFLAARLATLTEGRRHGVTVVVTSPRPGSGTTTVAVNTALAFAALGREVILVGADLHAPRIHECLGLARAPGLLDVLDGDSTAEAALQRTTRPNLKVLTTGHRSTGTRDLHIDHLRLALAQLVARAVVVVDAPPLLSCPESLILTNEADVVLLVADLRSGTRSDAEDAVDLCQGFASQTAGWVVNRPQHRARRRSRRFTGRRRTTATGIPDPQPVVRSRS